MTTTNIDAIRDLLRQDLQSIADADGELVALNQQLTAPKSTPTVTDSWDEQTTALCTLSQLCQDIEEANAAAHDARVRFDARTAVLNQVALGGDTAIQDIIAEAARPVTPVAGVPGGSGLPAEDHTKHLKATGETDD